jgi:phosphoribosylformylglycinamidine cyclo-ligase
MDFLSRRRAAKRSQGAGPVSATPGEGVSDYRASGVDYESLDAGKRAALAQALTTSGLMAARAGVAHDESRGEPAFVFEFAGRTFGFVLEGLGTKSLIAQAVFAETKHNCFANVAHDTVAAIVNDLCCVGALPLVVNAYFATGVSDWYDSEPARHAALLDGWRKACEEAGATWGGGESPSLPELVNHDEIELAGSAIGAVPEGRPAVLGQELGVGDEIVFVASNGLHANGSSLARLLVREGVVPGGYGTELPGGDTFGEALLKPSIIYVPLIEALMKSDLPIHYLSHITGHGMLKLMRPSKSLSYVVTQLPEVPVVLDFMRQAANMSLEAAYATFNMGCGYAIYCGRGAAQEIVDIATRLDFDAHIAGHVAPGPRRVVLENLGITYDTGAMDLTPRRAA